MSGIGRPGLALEHSPECTQGAAIQGSARQHRAVQGGVAHGTGRGGGDILEHHIYFGAMGHRCCQHAAMVAASNIRRELAAVSAKGCKSSCYASERGL